MKAVPILVLCVALAACSSRNQSWEGYALRDRPGEDSTRLIGAYSALAGCRTALLSSASDPSTEALVCTRGCDKPHEGVLDGCIDTVVIRPVQPRLDEADALTLPAAPSAGAVRSSGSDPSRP